jgi:divalent anion:Na+ symporter, DASS family
MTFAIVTNTIPASGAFQGFASQVVWLVVIAFFIAKGFVVTGFGTRIGCFFTRALGKKSLGLAYGIVATDFILSPLVPSVTARSAGIVYPIARSISTSYDSHPHSESASRIGEFLCITTFQAAVITSAMFMTAMAANPLLAELTSNNVYKLTWATWALAACVPGIVSLIVMPLIIYKLHPPQIKDTPNAPKIAQAKLDAMGTMSISEWIMAGTLVIVLSLWIFGEQLGISPVVAALVGLCILLVSGVLSWNELLAEKDAWETFIWFCVLLMLAKYMGEYGITSWFSESCVSIFSGLDWKIAFPVLGLIYFYSHYAFASSTAHVSAMYLPFLLIIIGLGAPSILVVFILIYFSSLFGGLTHYSLAPAPLLFSSGYVDLKTWWKLGFILSVVNITIWCTIGSLWWKILGFW